MSKSVEELYWRKVARGVTARWNFACWLESYLRCVVTINLACTCLFILFRSSNAALQPLAWVYLGAVAGSAAACFFIARKRFFSLADGFVRVDGAMGLNNRLTSASKGVGPWPKAVAKIDDGLRWRQRKVLGPLGGSLLLLALSLVVPVKTPSAAATLAPNEPIAWEQIEAMLETIEEESLVDEEVLSEFEDKLEELRRNAKEDWYQDRSLEATENLKAQLGSGLQELRQHMQELARDFDAMENALENESIPPEAERALKRQLEDSLDSAELGQLPPDKALVEALKDLDWDEAGEARKELREKLGENLQSLDELLGKPGASEQEAPGCEDGQQCEGGINRGPGETPLSLSDKATKVEGGRVRGIEGEKNEDAEIGDSLGEFASDPKDENLDELSMQSGGAVSELGAGGDTAWKETLTPDEREILQNYFK